MTLLHCLQCCPWPSCMGSLHQLFCLPGQFPDLFLDLLFPFQVQLHWQLLVEGSLTISQQPPTPTPTPTAQLTHAQVCISTMCHFYTALSTIASLPLLAWVFDKYFAFVLSHMLTCIVVIGCFSSLFNP